MATQKLVAVKEFCSHHNLDPEFINELYRNEIIELVMVKRTGFIPGKNLDVVEKIVRLHNDLQINIEGIASIFQLLSLLEEKEMELKRLRNELEFYASK